MKRKVYTISYDCGEWLWVKDADDETMYVGMCVSLSDVINEKQHTEFLDFIHTWSANLAPIVMFRESSDTFNWLIAHQRGLEIARCIKELLGDAADVRYVKPTEDPSYIRDEGYEILKDGNIVLIKRLWRTPI